MKTISAILLLSLFVGGCSSEPEQKPNEDTAENKEKTGNVILDYQARNLNKAKAVEQLLIDTEFARRKQMNEQEGISADGTIDSTTEDDG